MPPFILHAVYPDFNPKDRRLHACLQQNLSYTVFQPGPPPPPPPIPPGQIVIVAASICQVSYGGSR